MNFTNFFTYNSENTNASNDNSTEIRVGDSDFKRSYLPGKELKLKELLYQSSPISCSRQGVSETINRMAQIDPDFGKKGHGYSGSLAKVSERLSPDQSLAVEVILDAHKRYKKNKNPALIKSFSDQACTNASETLRAAMRILNEEYGGSVMVKGVIKGSERQHWLKVETPLLRSTIGNWSVRPTPEELPIGSVLSKESGVKIGEQVIYIKSNTTTEARVVNASHEFNGLRAGTSTIEIMTADRKFLKVAPWLLKKFSRAEEVKALEKKQANNSTTAEVVSDENLSRATAIQELNNYLKNDCPSLALSLAVQDELQKAVEKLGLNFRGILTAKILGEIRMELYDRPINREAHAILIDTKKRSTGSFNPGEERLCFIENLMSQLNESHQLDFAKAYEDALKKPDLSWLLK